MLRRLTVKNLAIVEDLEIELEPGLTVITGETGAGKSILVDALSLLAGGRGSVALVRQGALRLSVTGEFDADATVRRILADAGLPDSATVLLRREFSGDGKGRVFIEDEPASGRSLAERAGRSSSSRPRGRTGDRVWICSTTRSARSRKPRPTRRRRRICCGNASGFSTRTVSGSRERWRSTRCPRRRGRPQTAWGKP